MDDNQNPEENRKRWKTSESQSKTGILKQDENNNFFIDDCIFQYNIVSKVLKPGDVVEILSTNANTNAKTKDKYPFFVTKFNKVNP